MRFPLPRQSQRRQDHKQAVTLLLRRFSRRANQLSALRPLRDWQLHRRSSWYPRRLPPSRAPSPNGIHHGLGILPNGRPFTSNLMENGFFIASIAPSSFLVTKFSSRSRTSNERTTMPFTQLLRKNANWVRRDGTGMHLPCQDCIP